LAVFLSGFIYILNFACSIANIFIHLAATNDKV